MNSLNQKNRLISIFQFIGVYLLGFLLMGFAFSSFQGVTTDEKDALEKNRIELEEELKNQKALLSADRREWEILTTKAHKADTMTNLIEKLETQLNAAVALGPAGDLTAAKIKQNIDVVQSQIISEFINILDTKTDTSLQGKLKNSLSNAYQKMLVAKKSFQDMQENISEDQTDDALQVKNNELQTTINRMEMDQKVGNKLSTCTQQLTAVKKKIGAFAESAEVYSGNIKGVAEKLEEIEGEIKNKLLGKNREEREELKRKIDDLNDLSGDLVQMIGEMKAAAK